MAAIGAFALAVTDPEPPRSKLATVRLMLWVLVVLAVIGTAALLLIERSSVSPPHSTTGPLQASFGGPFTLVGSDGKTFSSRRLEGKPYAIYFGFTRCGDVCPTTLSRLVKLRKDAGPDAAFNIVFVTIDPEHDGPAEVGQYASLFNAPIIGLTGSPAQIEQVKKRYGIYAQPVPHAAMGKEMEHTATVLLFDSQGKFVATISPDEADSSALEKIKRLMA